MAAGVSLALPSLGISLPAVAPASDAAPPSGAGGHQQHRSHAARIGGGDAAAHARWKHGAGDGGGGGRDHGVPHSARLVRNLEPAPCSRSTAEVLALPAWPGRLVRSAGDWEAQLALVVQPLCEVLAGLQESSLVLEVGSHCGELAIAVARRCPGLRVQPSESDGPAASSVQYVLLQERVLQECFKPGAGTLLAPVSLDPASLGGWLGLRRSDISCVFAVSALQFMSEKSAAVLLDGCSRVLKTGGLVFLCGPFFDHGEVSELNLSYHGALQDFSAAASQRRQTSLCWGLHDVRAVRAAAEAVGLELAEQRRVGAEWIGLVFRKTLPDPGRRCSIPSGPLRPAALAGGRRG